MIPSALLLLFAVQGPESPACPVLELGENNAAFRWESARSMDGAPCDATSRAEYRWSQALTDVTADSRAPAWSPDGRHLAFESNRSGSWDLYLMRPDGSGIQRLTADPSDERQPAWSPDGSALVFVRTKGGTPDLYTLQLKSREITRLTYSETLESFPAWSPDASRIAFTAPSSTGALNLFVIGADGRGLTQLTRDATRSLWPRWSPDGRQLAFFSRRDTAGADDEIYLLEPDTGRTTRVTRSEGHDFSPVWSPDARYLAVVSIDPVRGRAIRIIDMNGRTHARIAEGIERTTDPAWSPRGDRIAYAAPRGERLAIVVETVPPLSRR